MKTFQISPVPALAPFVDRIWGWESTNEELIQLPTLLPGTGAELYLHSGDPFRYLTSDNRQSHCPRGHLFCLRRHAVQLLPASNLSFIAVRFKAGMLHRFTTIPGDEVLDQTLSTEDLWGIPGAALPAELAHKRALPEKLAYIQSFLLKYLKHKSSDPVIEKAVPIIYRDFSSVRIDSLAKTFQLGRRQFERRFSAYTGTTPSELRSLSRFQHTFRKLMLDTSGSPRDVALSSGYYDQAHFIHDFRQRTYSSPEKFLKEARQKTHFYNTRRHPGSMLQTP